MFLERFNFNYHVAHHSDERAFVCDFAGCLNAYKTTSDLKQHQKTHEKALGLQFFCKQCNKQFDSSTKQNVHLREEHCSKSSHSWCEMCCREFVNLKSHHDIVHLKIKKYVCDLCEKKRFGKMNGLVRHIKAVHLGVSPYSCNECDKKFKEKSSLKK